jgi:hypothetical protein
MWPPPARKPGTRNVTFSVDIIVLTYAGGRALKQGTLPEPALVNAFLEEYARLDREPLRRPRRRRTRRGLPVLDPGPASRAR